MFKVPDWETDVPISNVVFTKKANNKKFKAESADVNPFNNFVKNPQSIPQNAKPIVGNGTGFEFDAKAIVSNGTSSPKKKKPKKRKLNNNSEESIFKKESEGFEFDELLVNAKKNKLNQIYKKDDCEQLLFGKDASEAPKSNIPKKSKKNKKSQLELLNGKNDVISPSKKRKHRNDDEAIDSITVKAKKIKLNDEAALETEPTKSKNKKKQKLKNIIEQRDINGNEQKNTDNEKVKQASSTKMVASEAKHTNNDAKMKHKFKKMLEHRTKINMTGNNLRERMLDRLKAAQFRYLNEKLYTSSGHEAQKIFQEDPTAFRTYHLGYQLQVKKWPVNPLDVIVKKIQKMPKTHVIADMGCGEAALSKQVPNRVHSFDLVASAPGVVECDMARTPLLRESMDVVVYCLALMGTELTQYLLEANRVLKTG
ncbi:putative methyltransferase domain-containing protein [Phthorimaea operculella]|nr:putative methyltransferase domain-containing protein [Phthorimaea operculella]